MGTQQGDPFEDIGSGRKSSPTSLVLQSSNTGGGVPASVISTPGSDACNASSYATPMAPTPLLTPSSGPIQSINPGPPSQTMTSGLGGFSTHSQAAATPYLAPTGVAVGNKKSPSTLQQQQPLMAPITSPLPLTPTAQAAVTAAPTIGAAVMLDSLTEDGEADDVVSRMWIPCQATAQVLANPAGADRSLLTLPGVQVREEFPDPVRNLVTHYRGDSEAEKRQVLNANTVSQDMSGLCQLIQTGNYRAAVNLTARLLQAFNQGIGKAGSVSRHTPLSIKIWYIRFSLLVKLKQFSMVGVESETFGDLDKADLYYEFYPPAQTNEGGITSGGTSASPVSGSMVPFGLRLLVAQLPQHLNKPQESVDRLSRILFVVRKIIARIATGEVKSVNCTAADQSESDQATKVWQRREVEVLHSIVNCALLQKDFEMAVSTLECIYDKEILCESSRVRIKSSLGRVFLQLGDIATAAKYFAQSKQMTEKIRETAPDDSTLSKLTLEGHIDDAFLGVANGNFEDALSALTSARNLEPQNPAVVNNMSVCLLYTGKLSQALSLLEGHLTNDPADFLRETQVLNLATLYELESSYANQKKQSLLDFVARYSGDGANTSCLKF